MSRKPWSKKQRAKFLATIKARNEIDTPKKRGKKKPYRKPSANPEYGIVNVAQAGPRSLLIHIKLV